MWNEVIVPGRFFDTIAMASSVGTRRNAFLFLTHGQATGKKFGNAGLAGLRLLYPVFGATMRALARVTDFDGQLVPLIDALPTAVALGDAEGRLAHQSTALRALLCREPMEEFLVDALHTMLRRVAVAEREARNGHWPIRSTEPVQRTLTLGHSAYHLSGVRVGSAGAPAHIAVIVERAGPPPFPAAALRSRQLTPREIEVTRLVALGSSPALIAEQLTISRFTARHHVESIMQKLNVHSLAALVAAVAAIAGGERESCG